MSVNDKFNLTFWSGVGSITGANFMLEIPKGAGIDDGKIGSNGNFTKILIDCGLIQGDRDASIENRRNFEYDPKQVEFLFVTHAHLDHVGRIPKLVKDGFRGVIYSTPETKALAELILEDAVGLLQKEAVSDGVLPLYERQDLALAMSLWKEIPYHTRQDFDGGWNVYFRDAGHILGSSIIQFEWNGRKIAFTGDLGNSPSTLLKDTENVAGVDYLVMESVYGDRNHEPHDIRRGKLKTAILDAISRKGVLLIPAFSLERTQVLLSEINDFMESGEVPPVPVFIDSPLAIKITRVYKEYVQDFNDETQAKIRSGDDIFNFPKLRFTENMIDSKMIEKTASPKVIIAGSGMSMGGRVLRHESETLSGKNNIMLLVGYQTVGTIGRHISEGAKKVMIDHQEIKVNAEVRTIFGYSSHKDSDHLVGFVEESNSANLKKVFTVMGEIKSATFLAQKIRDNVGVDAQYPERGVKYILD